MDYHYLVGEPLEPINQEGLLPLIKKAKEEFPEKDIWCWTGYNFDTDILENMYVKNSTTKELLKYIDIVVDGQFEIENKITDLKFRGSTNQRKIDVQKSLSEGNLVKLSFGDEARYEKKNPKIMYFEEFKNTKNTESNVTNEYEKVSVNFGQISFFEENHEEIQSPQMDIEQEKIAAKGIE